MEKGIDLSQKMMVNRDMTTVEKIKLLWSKLTYFGWPNEFHLMDVFYEKDLWFSFNLVHFENFDHDWALFSVYVENGEWRFDFLFLRAVVEAYRETKEEIEYENEQD